MMSYSSEKEENIAKYLVKNLHKEDFKNRSLASIDRIIELYFTKYNNNPSEEKEVISFLFKYLKDKKEPASILFRHITNSPERYNIIIRLYNEHRWDFNFDITPTSVFLTAFDLIKINLKLKKILYFCTILIPFFLIFSISSHQRVNSLKYEFKKQLNENIIQLQNEISNKEKLENELNLLKQNHENVIKTKEQLGSEMNTLKQNMKEEILTFKQHFENELTSFKEKQQEMNELSTCKENLQQEKLNKIQIESELISCKENFESQELNISQIESELNICQKNFENEELNKSRIESELNACNEDLQKLINKQKKIEEELSNKPTNETKKKTYSKFFIFSGVDLLFFIGAVLFTYFRYISIEKAHFLIISFVFEFAMNLQIFFDCNSVYFYYCFTVVFIISITSLLFVSNYNKLLDEIFLIVFFLYIVVASSYKYALFVKSIDFCLIIVCLSFILESIYMFIIHYHKSDAAFLCIFDIILFIYYSYIEYSPLFMTNISFISLIIILFIDSFDQSGKDMLIDLFQCLVTLSKYCFFICLKQHNKIFYIIMSIVIVVEILCGIIFKDQLSLVIIEICLSFLLINYNIFILVLITIATFYSFYWIFDNKLNNPKYLKVFSYITILGIFTSNAFSILKFWKMYSNKLNNCKNLFNA